MKTTLKPYLFFAGNCRQAVEFYHTVFGGDLDLSTFAELPDPAMQARGDGIMNADFTGGLVEFMASDSDRTEPYPASCISLSITGDDAEAITAAFTKLAEGGIITSPLTKEFWGATFGTVTDKFGIDWMVNITEAPAAE
jgi:PhnB protein